MDAGFDAPACVTTSLPEHVQSRGTRKNGLATLPTRFILWRISRGTDNALTALDSHNEVGRSHHERAAVTFCISAFFCWTKPCTGDIKPL